MYLVVFYLLVWTLFQCILCENCTIYSPDPNTLYVFSVKNDDKMMNTFLNNYNIRSNTDIDYEMDIQTGCPGQLQDALKLTKNLKLVIYYGIKDFYKNNYNDVRNSNMEWDSDYELDTDNGETKEKCVCKSDESICIDVSPINGIKGNANKTCTSHQTKERQNAMLTSKYINIKETPGLYDLIYSSVLPQTDRNEFFVIVCNDSDTSKGIIFKDIFKTISIRNFDLDTCKNYALLSYLTNVIAIIAPDPDYVEKSDFYEDKPIIFYDVINNNQKVDMYTNAIIRETTLKNEAWTLLKLILKKWKRVAILSDDSAENAAFEREVRNLFEMYGVSYTVKSVEGQSKCCNFSKALSSLQSVDARIIIANIDQKYADLLVKEAQNKGMTSKQNIIWIARAWSKATSLRAAKDLHKLLTVTLKSSPDDALGVIKTLFERDYEYSSFLNEANFAQDIRKSYSGYQEYFKVLEVVHSENHISYQYFDPDDIIWNMPRDRDECTLRSDNFDKPCDDMVGIMIALVILVLAQLAKYVQNT